MSGMTPAVFAEQLNESPRTVRKFLRHQLPDLAPGKGGRWSLPSGKRDINALTKQFNTWKAEQLALAAARATEAAEKAAAEVEDETPDEVDETA